MHPGKQREEKGQGLWVKYLPPVVLMTIFKSLFAFLLNTEKSAWDDELGIRRAFAGGCL